MNCEQSLVDQFSTQRPYESMVLIIALMKIEYQLLFGSFEVKKAIDDQMVKKYGMLLVVCRKVSDPKIS